MRQLPQARLLPLLYQEQQHAEVRMLSRSAGRAYVPYPTEPEELKQDALHSKLCNSIYPLRDALHAQNAAHLQTAGLTADPNSLLG